MGIYSSAHPVENCISGCGLNEYICDTILGKRSHFAHIIIFLYRWCLYNATTPKNNSPDKSFVFVSVVSPTLRLHSR